MNFFPTLVFGLILLLSWVALGQLFSTLLKEKSPSHWAKDGVVGLSLQVAIGGCLNFFQVISSVTLDILIFGPLLFFFIKTGKFRFSGP